MGLAERNQLTDSNALQMFLLVFLTAVIVKILHRVISKLTSPIREIPSPPGHFLFGNLPEMAGRDLPKVYEHWLKNFSKNGMTRINALYGKEVILISRPEDIKKVLVSESKKFRRPSILTDAAPGPKGGIFTSEGKEHAWQRKLLHPSCTSISVKQFANFFIQKSSLLVKLWAQRIRDKKGSSCTIIVEHDIKSLLIEIINKAAFGYDMTPLSGMNDENTKALRTCLDGAFGAKAIFINKYFGFLGRFVTVFGVPDIGSAFKMIENLISEVIAKKEQKLKSQRVTDDQRHSKPDLLEMMMKQRDADTGSKMSNDILKSNILTFMVAGNEATSICLTWTLYLLALHSDKQDKAREEVLNASPRNSDVSVENIGKMPYVEYVLQESLRMHPPAAAIGRESLEPVTLGGVCIPTGHIIRIPLSYIHQSEEFWTDPLEFKPERFAVDEKNKDLGFWFLPFSIGVRGCIGKKFAMLEMRIIIASLLKNFRFSISPNHPQIQTKTSLVTKPVPSPALYLEMV